MATLSTSYTNARLLVPGATTTNAPDSTLLVVANQFYALLTLQDSPRKTKYAGGTFGFTIPAASTDREVGCVGTNISRIEAIRHEGTDSTTTDGRPIEYLTEAEFELERQTFSPAAGSVRCGHWYRQDNGNWLLKFLPAAGADIQYLSIEGEVERSALASGASTVSLSPVNIVRLEHLMASVIKRNLSGTADEIAALLKDQPTRDTYAKWQAQYEGKGHMLDGGTRGA